jgi:hypothetical protein
VVIQVEPFNNGAHLAVTIAQRSDRPDEITLTVRTLPRSSRLAECVLTATCGNKTRSRLLWLRDGTVFSRTLWPDYHGPHFAPDRVYGAERMLAEPAGSLLTAITTDEPDPAHVHPQDQRWYYGGVPLTQYWRVPPGVHKARVRVNGRTVYWASHVPVPGGVAFENFEIREPYQEGQTLTFGVTTARPETLGFR